MTHEPIRSGLDLVGRHECDFPTGPHSSHVLGSPDFNWLFFRRRVQEYIRRHYRDGDTLRRLNGEGC